MPFGEILARENSQIFLLFLLDRRQNIPKRIFSNISFTFIGLEAVWYFRHGVCIGCQQRGGSFGICNKQSILARWYLYLYLAFVINNPFSPDGEKYSLF